MVSSTQSKFRLGIDCRLSGAKHAGIGRYTENLIRGLLGLFGFTPELPASWQLICFFSSTDQARQVLGDSGQQHPQLEIRLAPVKHYTLAEQFLMPKIFSQAKLDLLHVPHFNVPWFYSGDLQITIHDLLWHSQRGLSVTTLPNWLYWLKYAGYQFITQQAISKANRIYVPSQFVKSDITKHYPSALNKICVTLEGIDQIYSQTRIKLLAKSAANSRPKPLIYYTGSLYPHKNIEVVLQAMIKLPTVKLVIAGSRSVFVNRTQNRIAELGLTDRVTFAGFVPDEQLIAEYGQALALVQPSLSEGFGLTGIEAMASGLPVLASDIPVFREIYDSAALYANPNRSDEFVTKLNQLINESASDRSERIKAGLIQSQKYSWQTMVKQTVTNYRQSIAHDTNS